ncbi:MAG: DNA polymerase III subunit delta [Deltaproteobacteria bacterium]|nr:DNA polymerase III subunit delta [Deltaproteobacteria bacterium]
MTPEQFQAEIRTEARKAFYLVSGPEPLGVGACLSAAMEALDEGQRPFNLHVLRLGDDTIDDALRAASTSSFFSSSAKIVVLKASDVPAAKLKGLGDGLMAWVNDPQPNSTIVLFQEKQDARLRYAAAAKKAGALVECLAPAKGEMRAWIVKAFKSKGLVISQDAAKLVQDRAGDSLPLVMNAAEKLSLWPGPGRAISASDVREQVPLSPSALVFELGDPMVERRPPAVVPVLLDLLEGGNAYGVIMALSTHLRKLFAVKVAVAAAPLGGRHADSVAADIGLKGYYLEKLKNQASRWTVAALRAAIRKAEDACRMVVTTSVPSELILEELCIGLSLPVPPRAGGGPPAGGR